MLKAKTWEDMTDDEKRAEVEQYRREEAMRLGKDPAEHITSMWAAFRASARRRERENAKS